MLKFRLVWVRTLNESQFHKHLREFGERACGLACAIAMFLIPVTILVFIFENWNASLRDWAISVLGYLLIALVPCLSVFTLICVTRRCSRLVGGWRKRMLGTVALLLGFLVLALAIACKTEFDKSSPLKGFGRFGFVFIAVFISALAFHIFADAVKGTKPYYDHVVTKALVLLLPPIWLVLMVWLFFWIVPGFRPERLALSLIYSFAWSSIPVAMFCVPLASVITHLHYDESFPLLRSNTYFCFMGGILFAIAWIGLLIFAFRKGNTTDFWDVFAWPVFHLPGLIAIALSKQKWLWVGMLCLLIATWAFVLQNL